MEPDGYGASVTADAAPTGFTAEWLALREPADTEARSRELAAMLARCVRLRTSAHRVEGAPPRFIDLACGTGANLRYLAPRVGGDQEWLLVDRDAALLSRAASLCGVAALSDHPSPDADADADAGTGGGAGIGAGTGTGTGAGRRVQTRRLDLVTELNTPGFALDFAPDVVVTASALLDLVSDQWLVQLVEQCRANRCTVLFALTYDGRIALTPSDPDDGWIRELVNRHQLGDKGFGPALGPGASQRTCELFRAAGYDVRAAQSDWNLQPDEHRLQQSLLEGWAAAATELAPNEADRCSRWLARRLAHVANETSRIVVGHEDVLAWPEKA